MVAVYEVTVRFVIAMASSLWSSGGVAAWRRRIIKCGGDRWVYFFFFQAEDGIRDYKVTGVQTCALPICDNSPMAAMWNGDGLIGLQFHPEVVHTSFGSQLLGNFLTEICGCTGNWTTASFVEQAVADIRTQVGSGRVICALSGGVDSAVVAVLAHQAVGDQLTCIFVANGLLRRGALPRLSATS